MRLAAALLASVLLTAGCSAPDDSDDLPGMGVQDDGMGMMGPDSYAMRLGGVPQSPMAPGAMFNVSVEAMPGQSGMHARMSDHIGAHHWNMTHADPTMALGTAATCGHSVGNMPGNYTALCQAPMEPGTYHLRAHARMKDSSEQMHHWWSDEQTFTVA